MPRFRPGDCPTCGSAWVMRELRLKPSGGHLQIALQAERIDSHTVRCAEGHEFAVERVLSGPGWTQVTVHVPESPVKRPPFPVRAAEGPCAGCGRPIQPGQAYAVASGRHIGC